MAGGSLPANSVKHCLKVADTHVGKDDDEKE
jgi:hypothetical protein